MPTLFDDVPVDEPVIMEENTDNYGISDDDYALITEHKRIAPESIEIKPNNTQKGVIANFGRGVFSNVEGFANGGVESVRYYLGKSVINTQDMARIAGYVSPMTGVVGLALEATNLGEYLANTETALKMQQKYDEYQQSLSEKGYDTGAFSFQAGQATGQVAGQIVAGIVSPYAATAVIGARATEAAGRKLKEYEDAGFSGFASYARGSTSGILNYWYDKLAGDSIGKVIEPTAKRTFKTILARAFVGAASEAGTEASQDVMEQLIDTHIGGTQESYKLTQTLTAGALGIIGGGVAGVSYAGLAKAKLSSASRQIADRLGISDLTEQDLTKAVEDSLSHTSYAMTEYMRNNIKLDTEVELAIKDRFDKIRGMDVQSEGIAPEDIERVANRKRDFDAIVDSVTAARDGFSETAPEVAMKVKSLDSEITTKLNAIAALERKGDPVATKLKANLDKQLKDMGLLQEQAAELQRLAVESRPDSNVAINATMQASVKHMDTAMDNVSKKISETMKAIETAEVEKQLDLNDRLDELTEQYAELEQERKDILNGVVKPEGRIVTTAAKIRQLRLKNASDMLRAIGKTRTVTKQEIQATYGAVVRAIKATKLPRVEKNALIAKYAKVNTYADLFTVYPQIASAIDEALAAEKRKTAFRSLDREIARLSRSKLGKDRALAQAMLDAQRDMPTPSFDSRLDAFIAAMRHAYREGTSTDYVIQLAEDVATMNAESTKFNQELEVNRGKAREELMRLTVEGAKGLKSKPKKGQLYQQDPRFEAQGEGLARPMKFMGSLLRDLELISPKIKAAFDYHAPFFRKQQNVAKIERQIADGYKQIMPGKSPAEIDDIISQDATQSVDDPEFTLVYTDKDGNKVNGVLKLTKAQTRALYAMTRNSDARAAFVDTETVSEETLQELETWMAHPENARHKAIVDMEMKLLSDYAKRIQALYAEVFPNAYFSPIENYFMTARMFYADPDSEFVPDLTDPTEQGKQKQYNQQFIKHLQKRREAATKFSLPTDTQAMQRYIDTMEHYLAFSKYVYDLKSYMTAAEQTLDSAYGKGFTQQMRDKVDFLKDGAKFRSMVYGGSYSHFIRNAARMLSRGVQQTQKQYTGVLMANIDKTMIPESFSAAAEAIIAPESADTIMRTVMATEGFKRRYEHGMYSFVQTDYGDITNTPKDQRKAHFWNNLYSTFPALGDKAAYLTVAHAKARELIKKGTNPADAIAEGIREADESQVSMNPARTPSYLAAAGMKLNPQISSAIALTTSTGQMVDRYMIRIDRAIKLWNKGRKGEATKELAKTIEQWHFWVPFSYALASGVNDGFEVMRRLILGAWGDIPLIGQMIHTTFSAVSVAMAKALSGDVEDEDGKKLSVKMPYSDATDLVTSAVKQAGKNFNASIKALKGEDGDEADYIKAILKAAEGGAFIYGIKTGANLQEFAKITDNVYDNIVEEEMGLYPWMMTFSGYAKKKIDDLQKAIEEEE